MQTNPPREALTRRASIEKLQECCRVELSATETYELALKSITHVGLHHTLQELLTSHARRTELLRAKIMGFGGDAPAGSGAWGAFAKAVQAGADLLGDRVAIAALEEGEDHALKLYRDGARGCDAATRKLIDGKLLPEQMHTHDLCRTLQSYVNAPS